MKNTQEISNTQDVIDVRDVIARFEELEKQSLEEQEEDGTTQEFALLSSLLDDLRGNGGDEEWKGDWYPLILVREGYFEDFAREEAESLGLIQDDAKWPANCIDWEQAADELKVNYTTVEFGDTTYYYR